jgi:DNA-binding NarL/FixJ family response regulator
MAGQIRVLLADDSDLFRKGVSSLLRSEPTITLVGETSSYRELLAKLNGSSVDVVLLDVHMPDRAQKAGDIKTQLAKAYVLGMSFANNVETQNLAKSYGVVRLLDKTELGRTLIPAIQGCIQQKMRQQSA